jgi:hypothetical protein
MAGPERERKKTLQEKALGVLCPEAQADGVPCCELGRDCETCDMAEPFPEPGEADGASGKSTEEDGEN